MTQGQLKAPRSLAIAHAFVQGGTATEDSERRLMVGGTGEVDAGLFYGFSYTALGHLHRPQSIEGDDVLRYSGTPLPYSFAEDHDKQVLIVNMSNQGECKIVEQEVPIGRRVTTLTGTIKELLDAERHPEAQENSSAQSLQTAKPYWMPNASSR